MAPRREKKTQSAVVAADSNVTPPKKRKAAANSVTEKQKQSKAEKHDEEIIHESASPPKKSRLRAKNVVAKDEETKSRSKRVKEVAAAKNDDAGEKIAEEENVENARRKPAATNKAGTKKPVAMKSKVQVSGTKKQKKEATVEKDEDSEEKNIGNSIAMRRNRRANKPVEENELPEAEQFVWKLRTSKRKIVEAVSRAEDAKDDEEGEEVATNGPKGPQKRRTERNRVKKVEMDNADDACKLLKLFLNQNLLEHEYLKKLRIQWNL